MKQAIITIFLSVLTFVLCACSGDGITDTYWRDDKTGEWLIGLTEDKLVMSTCPLPLWAEKKFHRKRFCISNFALR